MKKIAIIGSTGSIGRQALNVIKRNRDKFQVISISAGINAGLFIEQVEEFKPKIATLKTEVNSEYIFPKETEFYQGEDAFLHAITEEADIVLVALVGYQGIKAVLECIKKGKTIALANKESMVIGGEMIIKLAKEKGVKIIPVDSEHSAIWQSLYYDFDRPFKRIILTASGGAFRDLTKKQLENVTYLDALRHPNWKMGEKITVDCATLVNKAYEVAEAKWFYNTTFDKIDVIIHRESIIHSMVEFNDGAVIGEMSYPSMEIPISLAFSYPERLAGDVESLDFAKLKTLTFSEIDHERFPCFNLVLSAIKRGGNYPAIVNGADEEAVKLFLEGKIKYNDIYRAIDSAINSYSENAIYNYQSIEEANKFAIKKVDELFGV